MGKIYVGQTFRITLDTKIDLSAGTDPKIYYRSPDGTKDFWVGTVTETTKLYCNVTEETAGVLVVWAQIDFDAGLAIGEPAKLIIYKPGY